VLTIPFEFVAVDDHLGVPSLLLPQCQAALESIVLELIDELIRVLSEGTATDIHKLFRRQINLWEKVTGLLEGLRGRKSRHLGVCREAIVLKGQEVSLISRVQPSRIDQVSYWKTIITDSYLANSWKCRNPSSTVFAGSGTSRHSGPCRNHDAPPDFCHSCCCISTRRQPRPA